MEDQIRGLRMNQGLSLRLSRVSSLVGVRGCVADLGSDHAGLPIALVRKGQANAAIAVEVVEGPLAASRRRVKEAALETRIDCRLGDGFAPIRCGEIDTVTIAGMGGKTIYAILTDQNALPHIAQEGFRLVLQPMDSAGSLRYLAKCLGWTTRADVRVVDRGVSYACLAFDVLGDACRNQEDVRDALNKLPPFETLPAALRMTFALGEVPLKSGCRLAHEHLEQELAARDRILCALKRGDSEDALMRRAQVEAERDALCVLRERYFS